MNTITTTRILDRLRLAYSRCEPLPRADGRHVYPCEELKTGRCVCVDPDGVRLSLNMLQRLYKCVISEFTENGL